MRKADLVLEGGGVKGIGLVGAVSALTEAGYSFHRYAGTSAGAIVASFLAAGLDVVQLEHIMKAQCFADFEDEPGLYAHLPALGEAVGLLFHEGLFKGEKLHAWIEQMLADAGVHTWADLKLDDDTLPEEERYKLVVIVSDVSRGRELRLPWDYRALLGVDPDTQSVADAVRASASIPFFFRPFRLPAANALSDGHGYELCVDGGMLSNYPIDLFDRVEHPRWPTFGIKLSARQQVSRAPWWSDANPITFAKSLVTTLLDAHDQMHVDDPYYASRTLFVDTTGFSSTDFHLDDEGKRTLFTNGRKAAETFLTHWNEAKWRAEHPPRPRRPACSTGAPAIYSSPRAAS